MFRSANKPPFSWALVTVFIIVTVLITVTGSLYIGNLRDRITGSIKEELNAIAELKVRQIVRWWHERLGDAIILKNNKPVTELLVGFFSEPENREYRKEITEALESYVEIFDYHNLMIFDANRKMLLSIPENVDNLTSDEAPLIPEVYKARNTLLTDIHFDQQTKRTQLEVIVPVVVQKGPVAVTLGRVVLVVDPYKILYPLLESWPNASRTSETLLVKQEGDSVVYLNPLRHLQDSTPFFRRELSDERLLAAKAVKGFEGIAEGIDYRNEPATGVIKRVPGSGWFMISKVDKSEIDEEARQQIIPVVILIILAISSLGAVTGWSIWHQRVRFYRQKYEAEAEKTALRRHFDYILKYANDIVLLIDPELRIVEVNDRALETYQYDRNEIIGMNIHDLRLPEYDRQLDEKLGILRREGSATYETVHRKKDGTTFPVEISARLFEIEGVVYFQSIGRDITERKKIEERLNLLIERYNLATQSAKLAVWEWDIVNDRMIWDERVYELFGVERNTLVPNYSNWMKILHPDDVEKAASVMSSALEGKSGYNTEFRIIMPGGVVRYIKAFGQVVRNVDGTPLRMIGINYDITDQKLAELSLRETEQTYAGLFETVSDAIYIHKTDGIFIDVNSGAVKMYGYTREEMTGMTPSTVGAPGKNDLEELNRIINRVFETGRSEQFEFWGIRKNGEIFPKEVIASKGKYFGQDVIIATARDITLRKKYEDDLKQARDKAEESDRLKTAFLHNISHEIRTPMNAIVGFSALLDDPDIDRETRKHFTNIIYQSTNQLLGIISDIVDISNIETGQVKIVPSEVNINSVIRHLYDQFAINAEQQKLLFRYETRLPDERAVIYTDKTKLVQVITNLLGNAFKFTRQGSIDFGYRVDGSYLHFYVKDTGIGVPSDKFEKIFERFYQVEADSSRNYTGAGLGLSISKSYVELLGGKIWLKSSAGKGSEFIFSHPF